MTSGVGSATNLDDALRSGVVLTASEAVAIVLEVCLRIDPARDKVFARRPEDVSVSANGDISVNAGGEPDTFGASVASLLDGLLPAGEAGAVPPALRSLPARLRGSTAPAKSGVDDVMTILKWHLRADHRPILEQLGRRLASTSASPLAATPSPSSTIDPIVAPPVPPTSAPVAAEVTRTPSPAKAPPPAPSAAPTRPPSSAPLPTPAPAKLTASVPASPPPLVQREIARAPGRTEPAPSERAPSGTQPRFTLTRQASIIVAAILIALAGVTGYLVTASQRSAARSPTGDVSASAPAKPVTAPPVLPIDNAAPQSQPLMLNVKGGAFSPSFTADGSTLFFHGGRDEGRLLEASLTPQGLRDVRSLLADPAHNFHARPSPDGRWIAFDSDRSGTRAVYIMTTNGQQLQNMSGGGFAAMPSWSPDMQWLAFVRGEPWRQTVWNVWVRHLPSGTLKKVSSFRTGQTWTGSWFPDSRTLCYSHEDHLVVVDITTGRDRVFPSPVRGRLARTPAVSPDGSRVVFQVLGDGIWVLDIDSGQMKRVSDDGSAEEFAWDPHGSRVAYHSRRDGQWRIWIMTL